MNGFIKLHRKLLDWEWYNDANVFRVFMHMLLKVNFKDKNWQGKLIKRGQFVCSPAGIGNDLNLSRKQVLLVFDKLKKSKEIKTKGYNKFTLVTIVNFDLYQDREKIEGQQREQQTAQQRDIKSTQLKNDKKDKNININKGFDNYHHPIVSNNIKIVLELDDNKKWSNELKIAFASFCHHRNSLGNKSFSWGRGDQLKRFASNVNKSIIKNGIEDTIQFIKDAEFGGFYEPRYEKLKKQKAKQPEQTLKQYYEKYLRPTVIRNLRENKPHIMQDYDKHKDSVLELKLQLNCNNETLTTPLVYDVMYGMFRRAGAKPMSRYKVFRTFLRQLSDYNRNKGELRKLFQKYLDNQ